MNLSFDFLTGCIMVFLFLSMAMAFGALIRGPHLPDRVIALELISTLMVGIIALNAIVTNQPVLLRIAIVVVLITFIGTIAFAYYVEKRGRHE